MIIIRRVTIINGQGSKAVPDRGVCTMSDLRHENENNRLLSAPSGIDDRFRAIFDAVNDGIFISDPATGEFIEINEQCCRMFGYLKAELLGRDVDTLSSGVHPYTRDMAIELNGKARSGEPQIFEWQCRTKDGVLFWTEISLRFTQFGSIPAMVGIVRDIAERKRMDARIVYMAQHDLLTGLANRSMFTMSLDRAIAQSLRTGKSFALLYLDLDHFKDVNDTRGHLTGDRLLRLVAERLHAVTRRNENVARFGGDEFAILLGDLYEPEEIAALATRLIHSIGKPFSIDGNDIHVGASIGVAVYGENACDAETLLTHADIALYRAKAEGRETFRFFSDAMNEEVRSRVALTDELRWAIPAGQLFLVYQPQVSAKEGRIIGVEALVRWRHPRHGVLTPERFLPVAESSGIISALGEWVLREACRQGRQWIDAGIAPSRIAVNLSTAQFKAPLDLETAVLSALAETQLPTHFLELEITESTLIGLSSQHEEVIQRLRRAGVSFSLDDFGTGYSSLSYLRRFSVDRIKIAREFISELATSAEAASIVKLILGLSRDFGNRVIAEGVETSQQLSLLRDWDCAEVQGFYFAPPMSAEAIVPLLSTGTIRPSTVDPIAQVA
jgi:diguanylate cyclase (GGDEF)-like protein/PAS domain S-box-containing protein